MTPQRVGPPLVAVGFAIIALAVATNPHLPGWLQVGARIVAVMLAAGVAGYGASMANWWGKSKVSSHD